MTVQLITGDCRDVLATLPDASVQCCVTSPPYFGLRDYHVADQMGLESTPAEYIAGMVAVFREVRRVLKDDGVLWLNIGDSYAGSWGAQSRPNGTNNGSTLLGGSPLSARQIAAHPKETHTGSLKNTPGLKPKDLMMVPARLAIALQADGWWLRSDIIWHKPNPMPESVRDRPTSAHEHIFLLTKSSRYYYCAEAIREPLKPSSLDRLNQDVESQAGSVRANGGEKTNGTMKAVRRTDKQRGHSRRHDGFNDRWDAMPKDEQQVNGANARNVWSIATHPFSQAHFATFPPEIPRRCILAGSREGDTVLDPFAGAGTTLLVADRLGRNGIGIEINSTYSAMAERRIVNDAPLFVEVTA